MKKLRTNLGMAGVLGVMMFFIFTATGFAQDKATLAGNVTDSGDGSPLPGANIVLVGTVMGAASSGNGDFTVGNIPPGTYTVKVSFIGYETSETADVVFSAGETITMNFSMILTGIQFNPIITTASRRPEKSLDAPASISVIELREINQLVAPSSASLLANVTGIDMATTGIDRREIVMRGFNNAFSGAAYILTDNRRAAVASLDVNLHSIMPNMAIDLEKVEIVRGPGSALYGAGVDAGVIHYISKDPFTYPGTIFSFSGGERSSIAGHFRHAGVLGEKVGYKITGQYAQADDWEYDPNDALDAAQLELLEDLPGIDNFNRDYKKINVNGLLEFRLSDKTRLIANGGFSSLTATLLSGVGTLQADGYGYSYGQVRLLSGSFFAQAYVNKNDAGDSFVYGQLTAADTVATPVVDKSTVFNAQAQYDLTLMDDKQQLIFGVDYDRTSPETEGTIYGRNEDNDKIEEIGAYVQSTTKLTERLDFTAALRADYNNIEEDFQFSPRAALVFKPTPLHSFRATYNRAYALPGGNSLHLDIVGAVIPLGTTGFNLIQRGRGSRQGFTFNAATQGGGFNASSLIPGNGVFGINSYHYDAVGTPTANVPLADIYAVIYDGLVATPTATLQAQLAAFGINLPEAAIEGLKQLLNPALTQVDPDGSSNITSILLSAPEDVEPIKSTITQTFELGYKGLIEEKFLFAIDAYYTKKKNFISAVTTITPFSVFADLGTEINANLPAELAEAIAANQQLNAILPALGLTPQQVAGIITFLGAEAAAALPLAGVVQPDENQAAGELLGAYRNFGNVDFWGIDASFQYIATNRLNFFGNVSIVSDDFFDNKELNVDNQALYLALNASKFKAKGGFNYSVPNGFSFNVAGRYTQAYPVNSGPYVGGLPFDDATKAALDDIGGLDDFFVLDVGAGYDLGAFTRGMRLDFTVQNVLNNEHREFIGAPKIGRLALVRLMYSR